MSLLPALVLLALASDAPSRPRVVLAEGDQMTVRPGFVQALEIELGANAELIVAAVPVGPARLEERALSTLGAHKARLIVWLEESAGEAGQVDLTLSSLTGDDAAAVRRTRLRLSDDPSVDRTLALKVAEILDQLLTAPPPSKPALPEPTPIAAPPVNDGPRAGLTLGAGAALAASRAPLTAGAALTGGVFFAGDAFHVEVRAVARLLADQRIVTPEGSVTLSEAELGGGLLGLFRYRRLGLGAHGEAGVRLVRAHGTTPEGTAGEASRNIPAVGVGLDLRWQLIPQLHVHLNATAQFPLRLQRFAVLGETLADLGGPRWLSSLSLVGVAPW